MLKTIIIHAVSHDLVL